MRFFLIHGRHLSGRVQCSHRTTSATLTTMSSGNPNYHVRHLSGLVQCSHQTTTDEIRQPYLWATAWVHMTFKIEETTKNLNQVGRPRDLNPGPPECESRPLPRSHFARWFYFSWLFIVSFHYKSCEGIKLMIVTFDICDLKLYFNISSMLELEMN